MCPKAVLRYCEQGQRLLPGKTGAQLTFQLSCCVSLSSGEGEGSEEMMKRSLTSNKQASLRKRHEKKTCARKAKSATIPARDSRRGTRSARREDYTSSPLLSRRLGDSSLFDTWFSSLLVEAGRRCKKGRELTWGVAEDSGQTSDEEAGELEQREERRGAPFERTCAPSWAEQTSRAHDIDAFARRPARWLPRLEVPALVSDLTSAWICSTVRAADRERHVSRCTAAARRTARKRTAFHLALSAATDLVCRREARDRFVRVLASSSAFRAAETRSRSGFRPRSNARRLASDCKQHGEGTI